MGLNSYNAATADSKRVEVSQDCELVASASREAAKIGQLIFGGADRAELEERIHDLSEYLAMMASWGRDLEGILTLRPLWSLELEVPLKDVPLMLHQLLKAA